jgi:hypothetical protein
MSSPQIAQMRSDGGSSKSPGDDPPESPLGAAARRMATGAFATLTRTSRAASRCRNRSGALRSPSAEQPSPHLTGPGARHLTAGESRRVRAVDEPRVRGAIVGVDRLGFLVGEVMFGVAESGQLTEVAAFGELVGRKASAALQFTPACEIEVSRKGTFAGYVGRHVAGLLRCAAW